MAPKPAKSKGSKKDGRGKKTGDAGPSLGKILLISVGSVVSMGALAFFAKRGPPQAVVSPQAAVSSKESDNVVASGFELDKSTWEAATAGKSVFVKFLAPW